MKVMYPPGYHRNGFVATHALGHVIYNTSYAQVHELLQSICIYIYMYVYMCVCVYIYIYIEVKLGSGLVKR